MMSKMIISRKLYSAASKQILSKQSIVVQRCFATSDKFMAKVRYMKSSTTTRFPDNFCFAFIHDKNLLCLI